MDIDIKDYLTTEEIKDVCKNALYQKIREDMHGLNIGDIIANISNADVEAMVDAYVGEDDFCKKTITKETFDWMQVCTALIRKRFLSMSRLRKATACRMN